MTSFNQRTIDEFHARGGRGVGAWGDHLLLMTSRGRRSGRPITTPLVYRRRGGAFVVVASMAGAPENPQWFSNLQVDPTVEVEVASMVGDGVERRAATARVVADGRERDELYEFMTEIWPQFADYARRTTRVMPVVVLEPAG